MLEELRRRIDTIEESYEFFLAYAAKGLSSDDGGATGGELHEYLNRTDEALVFLIQDMGNAIKSLNPKNVYQDIVEVIERDAVYTRAAVQLVMAQPAISSQLIDNLNALVHFRALLTDLFLFDEVLKILAIEIG